MNKRKKRGRTEEEHDGVCYFVFIAAIFYHLIYFNNKLWAYDRQKAAVPGVL